MRKSLFHYLLIASVLMASPAALQAKAPEPGTIKRLISFTTQNSVKLEISFDELPPQQTVFSARIQEDKTGKIVFEGPVSSSEILSDQNKMIFHIKGLTVNPWMPGKAALYQLSITENYNGKTIAEVKQRIGFRFFESKNGNLYLNGRPIFLRGIAINPPGRGVPDSIEKSRKFAEDYVRFMLSLHVNIIRIPSNETWYNVCDELGMMVFGGNYGSTVNSEKPPKDYEKAVEWYKNQSFAGIASHPSLMIYAMTNEVPFQGEIAVAWEKFLSYAHKKLRDWDSTRTYIANAGYGYGKSGDICDLHRYWGWYYCSPFNFLNIRNNESIIPFKKGIQPITFTECVGNYTGPDGKYNLTPDHKNPGSQLNWTGHADWKDQARLADEHQSFTFKQATELFRRLRVTNSELSGVFPFTIMFYNWNNVQQFIDMGPKPVTKQARLSYQPVLVSWENWTSQVYAGSTINPTVHIINDDDEFRDLNNAKLVFEVSDNGRLTVTSDTIALSAIPYYSTWQKKIAIQLPADIVTGEYQLIGKIIRDGKIISENNDKLFIATRNITGGVMRPRQKVLLYDPVGKTAPGLDNSGVRYQKISSLSSIPAASLLVIGENGSDNALVQHADIVKQFIKNGGRILCLRQDAQHLPSLNKILPVALKNITTALDVPAYPPPPRPSRDGYYVNPERPDHPIFTDIRREQLRVWSDYTQWDESQKGFPAIYPVTDGYAPADKKDLKNISVLANYGVALEGIVISEIFDGKGSIMFCGLDIINRTKLDPVADKMLANMLSYMGNGKQHDRYPLITGTIVWGDYTSEKGVLTGVNSGLMVHSVPFAPANIKSKITVTREGNRFLGAPGGFNTRPGIQYGAYGRRIFGPYILRGFGNVPEPVDTAMNIGEGYFWCSIPENKTVVSTLVWNQGEEPLPVTVKINDQKEVTKEIKPGASAYIDSPVNSTNIKMLFRGDRRLVLLQTSFK